MKHKVSLIIGFYQRFDQLSLIFEALKLQSISEFEVVVADDGSSQEVREKIANYISSTSLSIKHVWHEDDGFRKTTILNKSILAANSPYLIFIDGDCIPERHFLEDHYRSKFKGGIVAGRRVELSAFLSKKISKKLINSSMFSLLPLAALFSSFINKTRKAEKGIRIDLGKYNFLLGKKNKGLLGCNFSIHKSELIQLNGFDERYKSPGIGEDTELLLRAKNNGMRVISPLFSIVLFHLYHYKNNNERFDHKSRLLQETKKMKYIRTPYGIKQ